MRVRLPTDKSSKVVIYAIKKENKKEEELIQQPSNGGIPVHFYKDLQCKVSGVEKADNKTYQWIFYIVNKAEDEIIEYKFASGKQIEISRDDISVAFPELENQRHYQYKFSLFEKEEGSNEWVGCNCSYLFETVTYGGITETKEAKNIHFKYKKNWYRKRKQVSNNNVNKKVKHNNNLQSLITASEKEKAMKTELRAMTIFDIRRSSKEFCDWLDAHRKMFLYQNDNAVMCSVVVVDGETFPATLRLELGDRKAICFPPRCSFHQLDRFINNQACWRALYDPSVWLLAQLAEGCKAKVMTHIVQVSAGPAYYKAEELHSKSLNESIACAQEHMLHYAIPVKWDSEFVCKYKKEFPNGTPLVCACEKGRVEDVGAMIEGARAAGMDVTAMVNEVGTDSYGRSGWTALIMAAKYEHTTIIEILLQYNADTATTDADGYNALHRAAYINKTNTTTVQLLLNNMTLEDINHKDRYGDTPLDRCYYNPNSIYQQLIDLIREKGGKRGDNGDQNQKADEMDVVTHLKF